jgi:hypothetical protein
MFTKRYRYYIRVTNVELFNLIYAAVERKGIEDEVQAERRYGYYELRLSDADQWRDLALYAQIIAQAQDEFIETSEEI